MKKILVIDDSQTVRQQVKQALASTGYEIVEALDGMEGLETIKALGGEIALTLCDVNMPRMTGLEMMTTLHRDAVVTGPILMLTTEGQPSMIQRAREAGAKGWIVKPFKADLLVAAVNKLINAAGPPSAPMPAAPAPAKP